MITYTGGNGEIDPAKFLEYVQKRFSTDLANMVKTRDELAMRQGALTAVKDAAEDRQRAASALADALMEADILRAAAKAVSEAAAKQKTDLDEREATLNAKQETLNVLNITRTQALDKREKELAIQAVALAEERKDLTALNETLQTNQAAFETRVDAFQKKVASLSL